MTDFIPLRTRAVYMRMYRPIPTYTHIISNYIYNIKNIFAFYFSISYTSILLYYYRVVYHRRRRLKQCNDPEKRSPSPVQLRSADAAPTRF